jgi:Putative porin
MKRMFICVFAMLLFAVCVCPNYAQAASEISELKQMLKQQNEIIKKLTARIDALESQGKVQGQAKEKQATEKKTEWTDRVKPIADVRYRQEWQDKEGKPDRNKGRIRARAGFQAQVVPDVDIRILLASGGSDSPIGLMQDIDTGFSSKNIWIDEAYFNWHPHTVSGLSIYGGKMVNPYFKPNKSELLWDNDLSPEGIALKYKTGLNDSGSLEFFGTAGGFWVEERSEDADSSLWGLQAGLKYEIPDTSIQLTGGIGYFDYGNVQGYPTIYNEKKNYGNIVDASGYYDSDFDLIEFFTEVQFELGGVPVSIYGDLSDNTAASEDDLGWLVGFSAGRKVKPGSLFLRYNYRRIESDAVLGIFTDSIHGSGGTDLRGHEVRLQYQLTNRIDTSITYFHDDLGLDDDSLDYQRIHWDTNFKF